MAEVEKFYDNLIIINLYFVVSTLASKFINIIGIKYFGFKPDYFGSK